MIRKARHFVQVARALQCPAVFELAAEVPDRQHSDNDVQSKE